ncbi:MAG: hypothetical protein IT205_01725, partial [Fimbriimonadaceae bacterium]|nr:hypothetical protein [Fimbriimonadaceae bacterium]
MTDGPLTLQSFYKYDIASGLQEATIPSPFTGSGTFCAAAWAPSLMSSQAVSGTLTLGDTAFSGVSTRSISYSVIQGTSTVGSGSITCSTPSTAFVINLPASATGAAQLVLDGSSFLKRVVSINLTGSNQAIGNATMQNGDVDNSGEVDAAD